jgi:four helix bundle protein
MRDFHSLLVWQRAHALTLEFYRVTAEFPGHERYGLTSQLRRAGASIPTNLAEGCGHDSSMEFARFVGIALASASEVEYHLLLAKDLGYVAEQRWQVLSPMVEEVKRMLTGLRRRLRGS